ncbi:polysaccharide deacetylase family protein [Chitinophaga nivalis]|uniref:Polysaccharide deacetylase family protein n=1 Tax=Chitinophaga nivalis TaxID=2991709 RepID=A0ABT3IFP8_9BACT|nr:polysaccharide deacetylase family protein [Chitinophaga nivalis]MCW3467530.1 polysaccharide deacetylase family protein [Chitinophaga nivalis]MCW3482778.1 polysaccharide deacetylase family protein [Chitinophaga nivalis]
MLNYRVAYIVGIGWLMILVVLDVLSVYPVPLWMFFTPLLLLPLFVWGAMNVRSGFYIKVLSRAATTEKVVALTFDDGPQPAHTPAILDMLQAHGVPAGFFCIGKHIVGNEHLLKRIHDEGHVIGNHTYSHHFWFDMYGSRRMRGDMGDMDNITQTVTGLRPRLFRPPYGVTNPNLAKAIQTGGYLPVGWNIRSLDTVATDKTALLHKIISQLQPGAVILLHDTCRITADILPQLIADIRAKGYRLERIDKMLNVSAYA